MFISSFVPLLDRDAVVNQLCVILVPPLLAYIGFLCIIGEKLANQLLIRDIYEKKEIKIRAYGIIRTCIVGLLFVFAIVYFSIYTIWEISFFFIIALLAYGWIKVNTYCTRLTYTHRYIHLRTFKKTLLIPFENVAQMSWQTHRGAIAYTLVICSDLGSEIHLSSSDFIGLAKLKSFYDSGKYKK